MQKIKDLVAGELLKVILEYSKETDISKDELAGMLEYPPDSKLGDLAFPCFRLSRLLKKSPQAIAQEITQKFSHKSISEYRADGGYINFTVSDSVLIYLQLDEIFEKQDLYGSGDIGAGKTVTIDYSSPNICKPLHIAHLRATAIGASIRKIYSFLGYNCVGINYLGDWGTQFGKLITAYKLWGDKKAFEEGGTDALVELYIRFHREAEENPALNDKARSELALLENGDEDALVLWRHFRQISVNELKRVYDELGISFDVYDGESMYNDKMEPVVQELREKNLLTVDNGASIVNLNDYNMPPCLILKSDGSSLYPARDIAAAFDRMQRYDFYKNIYVVGSAQSLHFAQWIKVVELMGYEWAKDCVHVALGNISIGGEFIRTRQGNMILLKDIISTSVEKVRAVIEEKNPDFPDELKESISKKVGTGAVIFNSLASGRIKDIDFRWEDALNFDGNSGPYVQYTYARACSVLNKLPDATCEDSRSLVFSNKHERELVKVLSMLPEKVIAAHIEYEPCVISRYLLDVCAAFNRFYNECPILRAEDAAIRALRVDLVKAAKIVIGVGLDLIGLEKTPVV